MKELSVKLENLKRLDVRDVVRDRLERFSEVGEADDERWFSELSFCVLTANSSAKLGIEIQNKVGTRGFIELPPSELEATLKKLGHRFYRTRAEYIVEDRQYSDNIKKIVTDFSKSRDAREWLAENVKGIGYKEGSHFLRNVGYENLMILDRHVLRILDEWNVIDQVPKTLTRKRYLSIEGQVEDLAENVNLNLAEIDLYIWYMDTGKILK